MLIKSEASLCVHFALCHNVRGPREEDEKGTGKATSTSQGVIDEANDCRKAANCFSFLRSVLLQLRVVSQKYEAHYLRHSLRKLKQCVDTGSKGLKRV